VTFFVGNAVRNAAADLREAVLGTASRLLGRPFAELAIRDGDVVGRDAGGRDGPGARLGLADVARSRGAAGLANSFEGFFDTSLPAFDPAAGLGEPYAMYVTGTQLAEVEVDTASGRVRALRIVAAHDVGRPVFPAGVVGQIEGGIVMGLGFALTEDFVPGDSHGFRQYRIPTVHDVPEMTVILVRDPGEPPELEAKGVAECANMPVAPAIMNAVAHATGRRVTRLPARLGPS
jgi:CO/xanthine dehydrogenase Mo-binding subunit